MAFTVFFFHPILAQDTLSLTGGDPLSVIITSSVNDLDDLIQDDESGLETSKLDEGLDGAGISLSASLDLLAALAETSEAEIVVALRQPALKGRQQHTRHVLLLRAQTEPRLARRLLHLVPYVPPYGVPHLGQRERRDLHYPAHLALRLVDSSRDFWEISMVNREGLFMEPVGRFDLGM